MLHENGKKHRENVERAMQERRIKKQREEKAQKFLSDSLRQMEQSALAAAGAGGNSGVTQSCTFRSQPAASAQLNRIYSNYPRQPPHQSNHSYPKGSRYDIPPPGNISSLHVPRPFDEQARSNQILPPNQATNTSQLQQERIDWQAKKLTREEMNTNKRKNREGDDGDSDIEPDETLNKRPKVVIKPGEGFYSYEDTGETDVNRGNNSATKEKTAIYLQGEIFFGLLEEEMSIQLWTGTSSTSRVEKQQSMNVRNWKNALVVQVANRNELQRPSVNVSYMLSQDDTDETIEKNVSLDRIRIVLGGDEKIPDSLEEARLLAMGGEEIHFTSNPNGEEATNNNRQQEIDEATGFSGWSTVSIKKTSQRQQHREERKRFNESKLLDAKKREEEQKRIAERRLEESRASNADDSALGAYDVWGKMDYKGVDISKEVHSSIEDSAKRLAVENPATGSKIVFKKRAKKKGQKAGRRRTSADDD